MIDHRPTDVTVNSLIERYDALLLDAYGVLVDGQGAIPGAAELLTRLNRQDRPYCVVTNDASRLPETVAERFHSLGLAVEPECIVTSGSLLAEHFRRNGLAGSRCVVLGPEGSRDYVAAAGGTLVSPGSEFDVLVIGDESGYPFLDTVNAVLSGLYRELDQGKTPRLVLPNPDLIYPNGAGGYGVTSGSIALMLEAALALRYPDAEGLVFARLGKPSPVIFEAAMALVGHRNVVMIGDQLQTDIRGANAARIDSALLAGGVSRRLHLIPASDRPTYFLKDLGWED
jgi:HAD superfamily hydrolase (TIGR01459 family)